MSGFCDFGWQVLSCLSTFFEKKSNHTLLCRLDRSISINIARLYRTTGTNAACVIAGWLPLQLRIFERSILWLLQKSYRLSEYDMLHLSGRYDPTVSIRENKLLLREASIDKWQSRWLGDTNTGSWTHFLIPDLRDYLSRLPSFDFFLSQALSGHGCFGTYLHLRGRRDSPRCWCGAVQSPDHVFRFCPTFARNRPADFNVTLPQVRNYLRTNSTESVLDYTLANEKAIKHIEEWSVADTSITDHQTILFTYNVANTHIKSQRFIYDYDIINKKIEATEIPVLGVEASAEDVDEWILTIEDIISKIKPAAEIPTKDTLLPYWNAELQNLKTVKNKLMKSYREAPPNSITKELNYQTYIEIDKKYKYEIVKSKRQAWQRFTSLHNYLRTCVFTLWQREAEGIPRCRL